MQSSETLVTPSAMAPAARSRATPTASRSARTPLRATRPDVNGMPARAKLSLMLHGTPWKGGRPSRPRARRASAARASSRASSKRWATIALSVGLTRSMCRTCASTTSSEVISPDRIISARREAESSSIASMSGQRLP